MIYYNLESKYPGDITKHCGLTIDEVDSNFYELETKINSFDPSNRPSENRPWAFSGPFFYPEMNGVWLTEVAGNTSFVSGTVREGKLIVGVDNPELYGVSMAIYGKAYINNTPIPNGLLLYSTWTMQSTFGINAKVSEEGDELMFELFNNGLYPNETRVKTVNRQLHFVFEYFGRTIVDRYFVFDENLVVEDYKPSLWFDNSVWKDKDIWLTD